MQIEFNGATPLSKFVAVPMLHGPLNTAALLIIGWDNAQIRQATPASGGINTILVGISTYGSLVQNSGRSMNITIAGLRGSTTSSGLLPLSTNSHQSVFASNGVWNRTAGSFIITAIATTEPHVAYNLSFILKNPVEGQDAPSPIEVSAGWPISAKAMTRGSGAEAPLGVHSFLRARIEQSDPGAGANNTFILQLKSRMQLPSSPLEISITEPGSGYIAGDLIALTEGGTGFRAVFDVESKTQLSNFPNEVTTSRLGISSTRILRLGSGYSNEILLTPVYSGTTIVMHHSVTIVEIVSAGKNYLAADLRATHPASGQDFFARTSVNATDGSLVAIHISHHGKDYGLSMFLSIVQYYPNTLTLMENTITGINLVSLDSTSNCLVGMVISTVGSGDHFRAIITAVNYLTGMFVTSVLCICRFPISTSVPDVCFHVCGRTLRMHVCAHACLRAHLCN